MFLGMTRGCPLGSMCIKAHMHTPHIPPSHKYMYMSTNWRGKEQNSEQLGGYLLPGLGFVGVSP